MRTTSFAREVWGHWSEAECDRQSHIVMASRDGVYAPISFDIDARCIPWYVSDQTWPALTEALQDRQRILSTPILDDEKQELGFWGARRCTQGNR